jgi:hypothetical protein
VPIPCRNPAGEHCWRELAAWVKAHDRELAHVYITHPHADHFLGLPEILAAFPEARPVALAESIPAMEEQIPPGYMQVWGGFFPGRSPQPAGRRRRRQIGESRRYLADFETALERSSTPTGLIDRMGAAYPDLANPYTLWVAAHDLAGTGT